MRNHTRRGGFTLMEVLLATLLAVIVLFAIFTAMDIILREMSEGRSRVVQASVGRAIMAKMSEDIGPSLAPVLPPTSSSNSNNNNNMNGSNSNMNSSTTTTSSTVTSNGTPLTFQIGLQGDNYTCTVYQTRMSRATVNPPDNGSNGQNPFAADVWRVSYFMSDQGLARQEIRMVTSDDVDTTPTDVDDKTKILAHEVRSVTFRYFDGSQWQDSWDGSQPGTDGVTPQGPPMAVEVTIELALPDSDETKTIQDYIAFPAAPGGVNSQQLQQSQQNGSSNSSGSSTSP